MGFAQDFSNRCWKGDVVGLGRAGAGAGAGAGMVRRMRSSNSTKIKASSRVSIGKRYDILTRTHLRWRLNAVDSHIIIDNSTPRTTVTVDIPITCYQLIGVRLHDRAEKDEIVKSVMDLKNAEIEEGYTMDLVISRQELLMDVRDKLLFEPEYAGNIRENIPPKTPLTIPCHCLPAALCLLQEVP